MIQITAMAAFTNQFNKWDPLTFGVWGQLDPWPRQAAWEARSLLEGRSRAELIRMAQEVDSTILCQIDHLRSLSEPMHFDMFKPNPLTVDKGAWFGGSIQQIRKDHCDVNLFIAAYTSHCSDGIGVDLPFEQWEGLAVIALWKLADYNEIMELVSRQKESTAEDRTQAVRHAAALVIEAVRACTLAAEGRVGLQHLAAITTREQLKISQALYEAENLRRRELSSRGRAAVMVRHEKTTEHQAEALRFANSRYFPKRAAAARYAADRVEKTPGETYTVGVVDGWLKAAGWQPSGEVPTA